MTIWHAIGGVVLLVLGLFLWLVFLGAQGFSVGFGGGFSAVWFLIPASVTFGGPALMWWWLPKRRRKKRNGQ